MLLPNIGPVCVSAILSNIYQNNLKILIIFSVHTHCMSSSPLHLLDLLSVLMNPETMQLLFRRINHMIASMITRVVFCKYEWLRVVQWKSFGSKIKNKVQSVDHWLVAMYCETIAENKRCHRDI